MGLYGSDKISRATCEDRHPLNVTVQDRALIEVALWRWRLEGGGPTAIAGTLARVAQSRCPDCNGAGFKIQCDDERPCGACDGTDWSRHR